MRSLCLLFANLVLLATAGLSDSKKWSTNKDSIIIEADYEEGTLADESADNIECRTIDGEVGQCVTVRRCHPILFTEDGAIRNKELAETFATTDSSCVSQSSTPVNASDIGSRTICCAVNKLLSSLRTGLDEELDPYPTTTDSILSDQSFGDAPAASTVDSLILQDNLVVLDDEPVQTTAPPFANHRPFNDLASETVVIENLNANAAEDENIFQDLVVEGVAESTTVSNIAHDDNIATTNSILEGALSDTVVSEVIQDDEIVSTVRSVDDVVHDVPQTTVREELQDELTTPVAEVAAHDSEESRIPEQIDIQDIVSQPDAPLADPEVITTQQTVTSSAASIENEDTAQTQQVISSSSVAPEDIEAPIHTEPEITTVAASGEPEVQNPTSEASFDSPEIASSSPPESELQFETSSSPSSIESDSSTKISTPSSVEFEPSTKISSPSSVESESSTKISSPSSVEFESSTKISSPSSVESESSTKISSPSSVESESSTKISSPSVESESSTKIATQEPEPQTEVPAVADPVEFPFEPEVSSPAAPIETEIPTQSQPQPPTVEGPAQVHEDPNTPFDSCPNVDSYNQWPVLHNYPFLASILTRSKTGPLCSGALIDSRHVLTAAHCLHRFNSRDVAGMQVRLGFSKHRGNDTLEHHYIERRASKVILHKHFHVQSKMDNNIALVQLNKPVVFDEHVSPINIFREAPGFDAGNCTASQAGFIRFGNRVVTEIGDGYINFIEAPMGDFFLIESLSRVYSNEECNSDLNSQVTDQMVCAKPEVFEADAIRNIFKGNDGGPLLIKDGNRVLQIGIKSWAYEGNQYPTVYTRIDSYYKWIADNLKM